MCSGKSDMDRAGAGPGAATSEGNDLKMTVSDE